MKKVTLLTLLLVVSVLAIGQKNYKRFSDINPANVTIARDSFGVPHIFAKTDAEVAYGFAFATCEDDFKTMQFMLLASKGLMGKYQGVDGAGIDFVGQLLRIKERVKAEYDSIFSADFKKVINGYVDGVNAYAIRHKDEVLVKGQFPLTPIDLITAYTMGMVAMNLVDGWIKDALEGRFEPLTQTRPTDDISKTGSNGFAFNSKITTTGETFLNVNSHQPLEGPLSWYEAHLCSEEGWNILGGTFAGGLCIFHGVNENLGWAHTVNEFDKVDVYELEMHPKKKLWYKLDGQYYKLEKHRAKLRVKLKKWLTVPVSKPYYWSKHGAVVKSKNGRFYAIRFPAYFATGSIEQWFRMNKATNLNQFKDALRMQRHSMMNVVYADRDDNIMYVFNGLIPERDTTYNYQRVVPGNTSKTLWTKYIPFDNLPQVENPECGYVYNCNNTPFSSTCITRNPKGFKYNKSYGIQLDETNRSLRFEYLIKQYGSVTYDDFKKIKYDIAYNPDTVVYKINLAPIFKTIDATKYPDLKECFEKFRNWNRISNPENKEAAYILRVFYIINDRSGEAGTLGPNKTAPEEFYIKCMRAGKEALEKDFGSINIALGDLQKHARGNVELPAGGFPDVLAAAYSWGYPNSKGKIRVTVGDSYIMLARFNKTGLPKIETVNAYGQSTHPNSPHYTDQMQLYVDKKLKPMTLDKSEILKKATRVYSPD